MQNQWACLCSHRRNCDWQRPSSSFTTRSPTLIVLSSTHRPRQQAGPQVKVTKRRYFGLWRQSPFQNQSQRPGQEPWSNVLVDLARGTSTRSRKGQGRAKRASLSSSGCKSRTFVNNHSDVLRLAGKPSAADAPRAHHKIISFANGFKALQI